MRMPAGIALGEGSVGVSLTVPEVEPLLPRPWALCPSSSGSGRADRVLLRCLGSPGVQPLVR